jgi:hypothetical protein
MCFRREKSIKQKFFNIVKIKHTKGKDNSRVYVISNLCVTAMIWCCISGRNEKGQLGVGNLNRVDKPTIVDCLSGYNIVDAACGRNHSLFLTGRYWQQSYFLHIYRQKLFHLSYRYVLAANISHRPVRESAELENNNSSFLSLRIFSFIILYACPEYLLESIE